MRGTHGSDDTDWISYSEKGSSRTSGTSGSDTSSKLDRHAISVRGRLIEEGAAEDSENDDATRRKERNSSIGDVQHAIALRKARAQGACDTCVASFDGVQVVAMLAVWMIAIGISFLSDAGVALAATIGGLSTVTLTFLVPSLLYAKLGLASDYQARPHD